MSRKKILFSAFILSLILCVLHFVALKFYFYWKLPWFDIPMHFIGGIFAGLIILYIYMIGNKQNDKIEIKENVLAGIILITIIIVGVVWETWEYSFGLSFTHGNDFWGTLEDLFMGVIGALVFYFYAKNYLIKSLNK